MKHSLSKILSALLAIAMVLGMLPVGSFAAESTDTYIADCPSFTLRGPEGVYPLENYGENGVLLFFGRSGCANTRALMGELDGRIGTLEDQGVQVFANLEDTYVPEDYADMASLYPNIPFTYSDGVLRKVLFKLVEPESDGFYFPLVLVINPEGQIIHYSTGYVSDLQTLLSKVEAVSTGNPLPEPEPADENYYGSAFRYTGDDEALAGIIRQQLAAKTPDIVIHDGTWDGEGDSWTGEALAYIMFDILEASQEEYGPYMIPDTWTYYPWAQQVVISLIYAREPEVPTEPEETEPVETQPAETTPGETQPAETRPEETKPAETEPVETQPEETEPVETQPEETIPGGTQPNETKPMETTPEETFPEETKPTEPKPTEPKPVENPFVDVAEDAYYAVPVLWAVEKGITTGMDATHFAPDGTCTRAQIVTFLWRANGSPEASGTNPFTDVPAGAWYTDAVLWAVGEGITTGTSETTFSPDAPCTRGQVATFLWRAEGQPSSGAENIFTDIAPGAYYYDAVLWAVAKGVTNGMGDGIFAPDAACTRGQIVTFLHRAML